MIPIIYTWGRSGGTILNKCLVAMGNLVLSEVHTTVSIGQHSPRWQARKWWDIRLAPSLTWPSCLRAIAAKCKLRKQPMVVRDWTTTSFYASENNKGSPIMSLATHALFPGCKTIAFVRNAIDSGLSFAQFRGWEAAVDVDRYALAYYRYAAALRAHDCPIFRYEDFCAAPSKLLSKLCSCLDLKYSDDWQRFGSVTKVLGDTNPKRSRGAGLSQISKLPRRETKTSVDALVRRNGHLIRANGLLGYYSG